MGKPKATIKATITTKNRTKLAFPQTINKGLVSQSMATISTDEAMAIAVARLG